MAKPGVHTEKLLGRLLRRVGRGGLGCIVFSNVSRGPASRRIRGKMKVFLKRGYSYVVTFNNKDIVSYTGKVKTEITEPGGTVQGLRKLFHILHPVPMVFTIPAASNDKSRTAVTTIVARIRARRGTSVGSLRLVPHFTMLSPYLAMKLPPRMATRAKVSTLYRTIRTCAGSACGDSFRHLVYDGTIQLVRRDLLATCRSKAGLRTERSVRRTTFRTKHTFAEKDINCIRTVNRTVDKLCKIPRKLIVTVLLPRIVHTCNSSICSGLTSLYSVYTVRMSAPSNVVSTRIHTRAFLR